jgi:hypothetical protein
MWGGKFGVKNTKIYGIWNPYIYEKDERGKTIWAKKLIAYSKDEANGYVLGDDGIYKLKDTAIVTIRNAEDDNDASEYMIDEDGKIIVNETHTETEITVRQAIEAGFIKFICPCDLHEKLMIYCESQVGHYKYYKNNITTLKDK